MPARDRDPKVSVALGRVVRVARVGRDLKQSELAHLAHIGRDAVSRTGRGERERGLGVLCRLAAALGMSAPEMLVATVAEMRR